MAENDNSTRLFPGLSKQLQEMEQNVETQKKSKPESIPAMPGLGSESEPKKVANNVTSLRKAARQRAPQSWSMEDIRQFPWRRVLVIAMLVLLLAVVIALAVWGQSADVDALRRGYTYRGVEKDSQGLARKITLEDEYEALDVMGRRTVIASHLGLNVLDEDGNSLASVVAALTDPVLITSAKLSLVYDAGGTTICLTNSAMQTETIYTEQSLLFADVAEGGGFCYLTAAEEDKTVLTVHSEQFSEVFRWYSKSRYLTMAALSDHGDVVAAVGAGSKDGLYWSSLLLLRTDQETPAAEVDLGEAVVLWVDWIGETCALVCRDQVLFYSQDGELQGTYLLETRSAMLVDTGDGYLALCLNEGRGQDTLLTLRTDGTVLGELALGREAEKLSAAGDYVVLLTSQGMSLYTKNLQTYRELADPGGLRDCHVRKDGSVLLITGQSTALYLP